MKKLYCMFRMNSLVYCIPVVGSGNPSITQAFESLTYTPVLPHYGDNLVSSVLSAVQVATDSRCMEQWGARKIQATFRMWCCRRRFKVIRNSVVAIQRVFRGHNIRKNLDVLHHSTGQEEYLRAVFHYFASRIQACYRGYRTRQKKSNFYAQKSYVLAVTQRSKDVQRLAEQAQIEQDEIRSSEKAKRDAEAYKRLTEKLHYTVSTSSMCSVYKPTQDYLPAVPSVTANPAASKEEKVLWLPTPPGTTAMIAVLPGTTACDGEQLETDIRVNARAALRRELSTRSQVQKSRRTQQLQQSSEARLDERIESVKVASEVTDSKSESEVDGATSTEVTPLSVTVNKVQKSTSVTSIERLPLLHKRSGNRLTVARNSSAHTAVKVPSMRGTVTIATQPVAESSSTSSSSHSSYPTGHSTSTGNKHNISPRVVQTVEKEVEEPCPWEWESARPPRRPLCPKLTPETRTGKPYRGMTYHADDMGPPLDETGYSTIGLSSFNQHFNLQSHDCFADKFTGTVVRDGVVIPPSNHSVGASHHFAASAPLRKEWDATIPLSFSKEAAALQRSVDATVVRSLHGNRVFKVPAKGSGTRAKEPT